MPAPINPHSINPASIVTFGRWLGFSYYPWQTQALVAMASGFNTALVTSNGAGKTSVLIPSFVLWFLHNFPTGRIVITSGTALQLEHQIFGAIQRYASHPSFKNWQFLSTEIKTPEGGAATGVSTDTPERLEGWHTDPASPLAYIIDEAKVFDDQKYSGIDRCLTDFRILMSTAGQCSGPLYRAFSSDRDQWWKLKVPSSLCPHIPQHKIEQDRLNYRHIPSKFASMHLAEFTDDLGLNIIPQSALRHALDNPPPFVDGPRVAFCDFAAGGDKDVLALRHGNRLTIEAKWTEANTAQAVRRFIAKFQELDLKPNEIYADAGGLGAPMCDKLDEEGWPVRRVLNGDAANDEAYSNRGSEIWFLAKRAIEDGRVILPADPEFFEEATNRQIHYDNGMYLLAEPKRLMKKRGVRHSPDIADAVFGAIVCGPDTLITSPKAHARQREALAICERLMRRSKSEFATEYVNWDLMR
jgi:phage terminase large subunit